MLIKVLSEENGVYKLKCSCGDIFYSKSITPTIRCKECRNKARELKQDGTFVREVKEQLKQIVYNLCEEYVDE
jgi:DNA-directed RNA polymerase subunit RPC12/RpoP